MQRGVHSIVAARGPFYSRTVDLSFRPCQKVEPYMAYKMTQQQFEAQRPASPEDLKRVFETAVCEIHQADVEAKERLRYRAPIVSRARILGLSQAGAEKRALSDAARALAQLWKV
ncbi:MAG: hypothetical protein JWQ87_1066 [Candidatus Sulfotelmatobacter sp.]|nr:hypothetical protein [Candidatus Sulfotelmatobacter sp.]